jgi:hypothetical protein
MGHLETDWSPPVLFSQLFGIITSDMGGRETNIEKQVN